MRARVTVAINRAARIDARGDDDCRAERERAFNRRQPPGRHASAAERFDDDAARADGLDQVFEQTRAFADGNFQKMHIHFESRRGNKFALRWFTRDDDARVIYASERAQLARLKCVERGRVRFRNRARRVNLIVEHNQDAASARVIARRDLDRGGEIRETVVADFGRGSHRAGKHDGFTRANRDVAQVRRFFKHIRAVRNDDAIHRVIGDERGDAAR